MLGETLEERMKRKDAAVARVMAPTTVDVPGDIRNRMLYPAEQYVAIATGYGHGSLKFEFHKQLSDIIFDHLFPDEAGGSDWRSMRIHDAMCDIVDFMDETIDLPLRELTARELKMYANKLINILWANIDTYRKACEEED